MRWLSPLLLLVVALLLPGAAAAAQDDLRLPLLFERLGSASSEDEAHVLEAQIWSIWTQSGDGAIDRLMLRGIAAMGDGDSDVALAAFDAVVKRRPGFAEGWNKRATVLFLRGDYTGSVIDIEKTLALEPHHFGALSGLGQIYLALDKKQAALKAFAAALAIDPQLSGVKAAVDNLKKALEGQPT